MAANISIQTATNWINRPLRPAGRGNGGSRDN